MFTGYAALTIAEVLPPGGRMVSLEIDPYLVEFTAPLFANSPHGHKIDVRLGPALQASTLTPPLPLATDAPPWLFPRARHSWSRLRCLQTMLCYVHPDTL